MMAGGPPLIPFEVLGLSFYFDNFNSSEEAAEYVIRNNKGPGTFLLRPSTRAPGTLTLTISIAQNQARHVNVHQKVDDRKNQVVFFVIPERLFPTFHDLYAYYSVNPITNLEKINDVKLLNPLHRASVSSVTTAQLAVHPMVKSDEIPPLPRKSSISGGVGTELFTCDSSGHLGGSNQSGPGLPPVDPSRKRLSQDSQGNEVFIKSSSSSGSGSGAGRLSSGAIGGFDNGIPQYFAPGSPSFGFCNNDAPAAPLSVKEQKKLQRQEQKLENLKKKEEKRREKKKKSDVTYMTQLGWCRPPMPIPEREVLPGEDDPPYYSSPRQYKDHLEELKKMLRESESCDCGLRMLDAELVDGWTVHRSRENATLNRVFYQHEDGNTTWVFPSAIANLLNVRQVEFIVQLCQEANQNLPACILQRHHSIIMQGAGTRI